MGQTSPSKGLKSLQYIEMCFALWLQKDFPNGVYWKFIHETWLSGYEGTVPIRKI
jgi:hypothetical protein